MTWEYHGLIGLLVLIADIWAVVSTLSSDATVGAKVLWVVVIVLLPILGFLIWLFFGPRASRASRT
jgi:succinate dehydrogenase/fumarate reductase cytochrome b subunit